MDAFRLSGLRPDSRRLTTILVVLMGAFTLCCACQADSARSQTSARGSTASAVPAAAPPQQSMGLALYRQHCQRCHDQDGKGTRSRTHTPEIPDFTSKAWHEKRSDVDLTVSIVEGKGQHMPAFPDRFAREGLQDLVAQVRSYAPQPARTGQRLDADFERRFRALQTEMAELRRQYMELSQETSQR
ncbi:MAG TPA: cytochrome c [Gemmataceae bacterium]|nr:cytochrome c [Gemmataceae bacterium]